MTVIADDERRPEPGRRHRRRCDRLHRGNDRNVFIEGALFDPVRTAATGRELNLQSDARYRFERGLDPEFTRPGVEIATRLIIELCGGEASEIARPGAVPDWRRQACASAPTAPRAWAGSNSRRASRSAILEGSAAP